MEKPRIIYSEVIRLARYMAFVAAYIVISTVLIAVVSLALGLPSFLLSIGIMIAWVAPVLFKKKLWRMFSRKSVISLFNDYFSIELQDRKTGSKETDEFRYDEIESYRVVDSARDDSTFLKLVLKNGSKAKYTFWGRKEDDDENSIVVNLHRVIKVYNETRDEGNKIIFAPSFFASRFDAYLLAVLTIFLISTFYI